ncbi:MAG: PDZ domain-containing protein [Myxococcota bacterium]|nr:PDZ domain-containing protein [Myxococcota bacterium]
MATRSKKLWSAAALLLGMVAVLLTVAAIRPREEPADPTNRLPQSERRQALGSGTEVATTIVNAIATAPDRPPTEQEQLFNTVDALLARELQCVAPGVQRGTSGLVRVPLSELTFTVRDEGRFRVIGATREPYSKGTLELEGYKPVEITWEVFEDGSSACHIPPLEPAEGPYGLYGLVVDTQGQVVEAARISGCGGRRVDSDDEGFFIERSSMSACILDIQGPDSALQVPIPAGPGDRDLGELVLPEQNVAMGINLMRTLANPGLDAELGGWRIDYVTPGSPADQAGLKEGDLIVQAQGQEVVGVPPARLLRVQAGERVELALEDGRTVQVDVESTESVHLKGGYSAEDAAEYSVGWGPGFEF